MKKIVYILILLTGLLASAQNKALFDSATKAYNAGKYQTAVDDYLEILDTGHHSAELYYNLGNAYYKMNSIAPSIYYYEKALLLAPNDAEIKNNLGYAQNMTLDAIDTLPETGFAKIYNSVLGFFSFDQWAYTAVVFMILFVLLYIAFYYFRYASRKRLSFILSIICIFFATVAIIFAYLEYDAYQAERFAIIFSKESSVKLEPNLKSQEAFELHEGTKVNVLDELDSWKKIKIADGTIGWIPAEDLKLLKNF